ncbi:hypothetical protein PQX77_016932 [Marasmius sp. AFHP31]|nr:hypothetical protein PQX77_016932 [Marasmius sp. AFHP31]
MLLGKSRRKRPTRITPIKTHLPLELWIVIASYVPSEALFKLLGINRQLFNWIMDRLYEKVDFNLDRITGGIQKPNVEQLRYSSIIRRVKFLRISLGHRYGPHAWYEGSLKERVLRKIAHTKHARDIVNVAPSGIDGCLLTHVSTLALCIDSPTFFHPFAPLVTSFWHANSQNLQHLTLQFEMRDLYAILQPLLEAPISLHNLSEFTFWANHDGKDRDLARFPRDQVDEVTRWLTSLILPARGSLRNLNLILSPNVDTTYLFSELARAPLTQLKRVVFSQACGADSFPTEQSFSHFLLAHCKRSLNHLIIEPYMFCSHRGSNLIKQLESYINWLTNEFSGLELPGLRTLQLGVPGWPEHSKETLFPRNGEFFLSKHSRSLASLFILAQPLDLRQLAMLTAAFVPDHGSLQYLNFGMEDLTPECLDLLARDLPRLKYLDIQPSFLAIQAPDGVGVKRLEVFNSASDSLLFTTQMEGRLYTHWALRRLQINIHYSGDSEYHGAVQGAFSKSLPPSAIVIIDRHPTLKYFDSDFNLEDLV